MKQGNTATLTVQEPPIEANGPRPAAVTAPENEAGARGTSRLTGLDGLRAIAVILVLFAHYGYSQHTGSVFDRLVEHGGFGVMLFFVLSGFLITYLLLREEANRGAISLPKFYARRTIRILPPLFCYLAVLLGATWLGILAIPVEDFLAGVFFVRNYFGTTGETGHLWSLGIEEQFYLVWPLLLVLLGPRWRSGFVLLAVILLPGWMNLSYMLAGGAEHVNNLRTDMRLLPLMSGVLLALSLSSRTGRKYLSSPLVTNIWVAVAAVVVLSFAVFTEAFNVRIVRAFQPLTCCACVVLIINHCVNRSDSWMTWFLEISVVAWLGRLSYSLYIWQQVFAACTEPTTWYREFPLNLAAAFLCAILSYYLVEQPFLRLRERLR